MQTKFNYVKPSECNIDYHNLINYAKRLENQDIPMHSLIIMRGNNICMGKLLQKPYDNNSLHRMFSIKVFSIFGHWLSVWRTQVIIR